MSEMTEKDAQRAFARLEELVAQLPAIQEQDTCLTRAREARALLEAQKRAAMFEAEIERYGQIINKALVDAKIASDRQDKEGEGQNLALARMYTELKYTRLATMERSRDRLRDLLKRSTLTLKDSLDEYALSDEDYETLLSQLRAYQEEYQQIYALCRHYEGLDELEAV
jgi:uncharacterized protein YecE (DUF72 family)